MSTLCGLEILARPEQVELLTALLATRARSGWEEEDAPDGMLARVYLPGERFCRELEEFLRDTGENWRITPFTREEVNWLEAWKDFFTPVEAGSRFLVLAPWMEKEKRRAGRQVILIEPKTAFGTGHHASTALCLRAISDLADAGKIKPGDSFLDLGTGSGILGLGAALLGLRGIGLDTDGVAVENALENRALNQVAPDAFEARQGSLEAAPERNFHLIVANILAEPLMDLAPGIAEKLRPGGSLMLSGLLPAQASAVEDAYRRRGLPPASLLTQEEWALLLWAGV